MTLALQIILSVVALICFFGGLNLLIKGANSFLPAGTPKQIVLDNLMRFMAGIYFSMSFLLLFVILHLAQVGHLIYFLGIIVIFSGLGRLYSLLRVGAGGIYLVTVMVFEICLGLAIILLEYLK